MKVVIWSWILILISISHYGNKLNKQEGEQIMGAIGGMLNAASGDEFVDGYKPERCWFGNGYITKEHMGLIRDTFIGSDELSDEDVVLICEYIGFYEGIDLTPELLISKLDHKLETTINNFQNNRGVAMEHEDRDFMMHMLGWRDYCLMMGITSKGGNVQLMFKDGTSGHRRGYYIQKAQ